MQTKLTGFILTAALILLSPNAEAALNDRSTDAKPKTATDSQFSVANVYTLTDVYFCQNDGVTEIMLRDAELVLQVKKAEGNFCSRYEELPLHVAEKDWGKLMEIIMKGWSYQLFCYAQQLRLPSGMMATVDLHLLIHTNRETPGNFVPGPCQILNQANGNQINLE